ncbi:MAG TPA: archaeosine biosynthesis radical SAM protein RaSEA [Methanothrix sp.]|nr:archaeosine biosynthesis radical SAM protein RaSEA [Methanothrix sp.]HOK57983.1 archaeosine biosynthesis radical SAM protein RaSEA [Methanothrix sp.]HOL43386.1 archaeosine biosynthesis radical SAM protein RaSEA [Methanothrix sp.]HPO88389.1 archaeosine biosynthesis radical SAM protein RaSEA [Methanothrix sp.]
MKSARSPVAVWRGRDLLDGRVVESTTVILRTRGCSWNRCVMCGYAQEGVDASAEDIIAQFRSILERVRDAELVKIYTSGSFLDPVEVPEAARLDILRSLRDTNVRRLVIESRPEHIDRPALEQILSFMDVEIGIGLESSSDLVRRHLINKGFTFSDFARASDLIHSLGGRVKTYLLLKPPGLSEMDAIADALRSAIDAEPHSDIISVNLCNVQRNTPLERMWQRGSYRPPWLWSAVEVLRDSSLGVPVICDPVGAGAKRGPHNCGRCDEYVADAIRSFSLSQNRADLNVDCSCRSVWRKVVELEDVSFGTPLV